MSFGNRILILVPHPDDEVVACAATLSRAQKSGSHFYALYLTNGCIAREDLWPWQRTSYDRMVAKRRAEGERVAQRLNITPLGWASRPARHLWRELDDILLEVNRAIDTYAIDQLWVPAYEGGNADHDGLNALAQVYAHPGEHVYEHEIKTSDDRPPMSVLEFAEYNFWGGKIRSHDFPTHNGTEITLILSEEEKKLKKQALALYQSEQKNLNYVEVKQECYRPLATTYDYKKSPHPGVLWYMRFHWVPFRHPRVDFTKSEEVSAAITRFFDATANAPPGLATQSSLEQKSSHHGNVG